MISAPFLMRFAILQLASMIGAGLSLGACSVTPPSLRPYDDPDARFLEEFTYECPDFSSGDFECPFNEEPDDKVVFSGPRHLDGQGSLYEPSDFNYDLFYDSLRLIDSVPPGESLYATTFYFSAAPWGVAMRDALLCAVDRGVKVKIIIGNPIEPDEQGDLQPHRSTKDTLHGLLSFARTNPPLEVSGCTGGCLQEGSTFDGKQHSKFIAASRSCNGTIDAENVIAVSSNNWTSSLVKRDNATLIKRNDERLYAALTRYFNDMVAAENQGRHLENYYDQPDGKDGTLGNGKGSDRTYEYHLFPRAGGEDPVNATLSAVPCEEDGNIRISMSRWTTARRGIVDTLIDRATQGCKVQIVVGEEPAPSEVALRRYIVEQASLVDDDLFEFRSLPSPAFHDKYFITESGPLDNRHRFVWVGSHNYSKSSLQTNEETALGVFSTSNEDSTPDHTIHNDFVERFDFQWERAGLVGQFLPD